MAKKRSFSARLARAIIGLVVIWLALSILAVAALRWIDPPYTAFMAEAQAAATQALELYQRKGNLPGTRESLGYLAQHEQTRERIY